MGRILVADDHDSLRRGVARALTDARHEVDEAPNGNIAIEKLHEGQYDVILSDLKMGGSDGMDVLRTAKALHPTTAVILMTAFGSINTAVEAMKIGAFDYVQKPFEIEEMELKIEKAIEHRRLKHEIEYLRHTQQDIYDFDRIVGASGALQFVLGVVKKVAKSNTTVLIRGETGTGKELIAGAIHHNSLRAARNFVKVNCAALQENLLESELFGHEKGAFTGADKQRVGRFEQADGGTLFLDEIGDMSANTQAKILRVLQEHEFERLGGTRTLRVDVRLIAATNRNLPQMVAAGQFREDLYYRLNVVSIETPPLRERKDDIPALAAFFLRRFGGELKKHVEGLAPDAVKLLMRYNWPGNIRELENAIERGVLLSEGPNLTSEDLRLGELSTTQSSGDASSVVKIPPTGIPLEDIERQAIVEALKMSNWVQKDAAELLSISPRVMNYKIKTLGIDYTRGGRRHAVQPQQESEYAQTGS
ncbi:MAG: sigma-54-dependent Fis family transcriptional regulator [Acidobacteria bacterium]|nr:sigma-54-dependent Fis family transcriptional regulator [Acidobacteriota bacterium]